MNVFLTFKILFKFILNKFCELKFVRIFAEIILIHSK